MKGCKAEFEFTENDLTLCVDEYFKRLKLRRMNQKEIMDGIEKLRYTSFPNKREANKAYLKFMKSVMSEVQFDDSM